MEIKEEKTALRGKMRAMLRSLPPQVREEESRMASLGLTELPAFQNAGLILAYMAMPHECDPAVAVKAAWDLGKRVAFPLCVEEHGLELYVPEAPDAFIKGRYGILEPEPARCKRVEPQDIEFIIVPGLAFDEGCGRLGQGAGYYDRLLKKCTAIKAGIALSIQLVRRVPAELHDIPLDFVISPQKRFTALS